MPTANALDHQSAIVAHDVAVTFDSRHRALAGLDVVIARGEFAAVVGPSGCGKSTLLRLVAGLQSPTSGSLTVDGQTVKASSAKTGFVFQQPTLLPWRTAAANMALPLELRGIDRTTLRRRIEATRQLVGLEPGDMSKLPRMLSGGMQMRVSLARALVTQPEVMLLDEPFGALDDLLRGQLNEELVRLWQRRHWTTMFVTHNVGEAVLMSQRVLVMSTAPGRFTADIAIDLPYPRSVAMRGTAEFARLVGHVSQSLRESA